MNGNSIDVGKEKLCKITAEYIRNTAGVQAADFEKWVLSQSQIPKWAEINAKLEHIGVSRLMRTELYARLEQAHKDGVIDDGQWDRMRKSKHETSAYNSTKAPLAVIAVLIILVLLVWGLWYAFKNEPLPVTAKSDLVLPATQSPTVQSIIPAPAVVLDPRITALEEKVERLQNKLAATMSDPPVTREALESLAKANEELATAARIQAERLTAAVKENIKEVNVVAHQPAQRRVIISKLTPAETESLRRLTQARKSCECPQTKR